MRAKSLKILLLSILVIVCQAVPKAFAIVAGTAHDLSPAQDGSMACQYCHTPHMALADTPLWNHKLSDRIYEIYWSSSLDAKVGQPTGSSKLCLSCHDGTIALESTIRGGSGRTYMPPGSSNLGTDLSDDHPISFVYSAALSSEDPQIRQPESLPDEFRLDKYDELQCATCHDPHDNTFGNFLVVSNLRSNLCLKCHSLYGWSSTIHASSVAPTKDASDDYLRNTEYHTVAENGCLCCHQTHSAGQGQRLFHFEKEEDNCLSCHNGLVAQTNMLDEFTKTSGHFVQDYQEIHDIKESVNSAERHVECVDCHNPHAIIQRIAQPPHIPGALNMVSGVTAEGSIIELAIYEYEVCFKCHGNNPSRIDSTVSRQITQTNTIMEFDQANPSYHPVTAAGANYNVPSLISGMDESTIIYCTDCHNSDPTSQIKGPHGSQYPPLLAYRYETDDDTEESIFVYELCYRCHDRESILNDESFKEHEEHIEDKIPCSACHDPHGISFIQGNSTNNSNLINFDTSIVFSDPDTGRLEFEDLGTFRGRCYLRCHGETHSPKEYGLEY
ncbi:MAG: cytochrome c3 family protein [Planctomycetota bacterium]